MIRWPIFSSTTIQRGRGFIALLIAIFISVVVAMGSVRAEPSVQSAPPAPKEKRLQWVTENGRRDAQDHRGLQMSREERRALRRDLHESRKEIRPHRRERPGR